jgi:hypothetical protein
MDGIKLVAAILGTLLTGGGTYAATNYLFAYLRDLRDKDLTPRQKRLLVLPVCAAVSLLVLGIGIWLGVYPFTPDSVALALSVGFTASQMFHLKDLSNEPAVPTGV